MWPNGTISSFSRGVHSGTRTQVVHGCRQLVSLPVISQRKVRMMSSRHAPYALVDTRATMAGTKGRIPRGLQLACMKPESLVIPDQPYGGEFVPGPCIHRPSHYGTDATTNASTSINEMK
ncbi:hypothetical protein MLD38_034312 [Melastoma candidum]|uniref:Uncharacterized protein n=1 Tax=Melastoma candidum TaxID=119954 RepID=A0ACB9MC55_9MYRT|nr:hypothetical protein MLD38_034312 [Melastoma candidum]